MKDKLDVEQGFYEKCAELLCAPHTYKPFTMHQKRRWYNRNPGNGRFEGFGLIRMFSPNCIHVCLKRPMQINKIFKSQEEVIDFLESYIKDSNLPL